MVSAIARLRPAGAALVCAFAGALAAATPASAAAPVRATHYKLTVPAPGHVSVAAVEVRVLKHGRGARPSRLDLSLPKRLSLPSSVRFFYARRRISPATYELLLIALNRRTGKPVGARAAARTQFDSRQVVLLFPSRASFGHRCGSCGKKLPPRTSCKRCWFKKTVTKHAQAVNADTADAADVSSLASLLRLGWTTGGDSVSVFGDPAAGRPADPTLDTGHLDDGHAFGWNRSSLSNLAPVGRTVVDDLLSGQQAKLIGDLELIGNADLNGNGRLDSATTPGGGAAP